MRADRHSPRSVGARLACCCALSWWLSAVAAAQAPLHVAVRVAGEADRSLLARVEGQLSDLPVVLVAVETDALEPSFGAQLQAAQALAQRHGVQVVVWFDPHPSNDAREILVHIATPERDRIATRRVVVSDPNDASALLEGAALVVRSATRALSEGGVIGVSREQAIADSLSSEHEVISQAAPRDPTSISASAHDTVTREALRASTATTTPAVSRQDSVEPPRRVTVLGQLAGRALGDGVSPVALGVSASVALRVGAWALALRAVGSAASTVAIEDAEITLARHSMGGAVGVTLLDHGPWQLLLWAHAAVVLHRRVTVAQSQVRAEPTATSTSAAFGPSVSLAYQPSWIGVALELGVELMPRPPQFVLNAASPIAPVEPTLAQPYASLGVQVGWP